jgi:hypothetical protein
VTLSDESEEEAPESEKFISFVAPLVEEEDFYYRTQGVVQNSLCRVRKAEGRT